MVDPLSKGSSAVSGVRATCRRWILPVVIAAGLANGLLQASRESVDLAKGLVRGPSDWMRFMDGCRTRIPPEARVLIVSISDQHMLAARLYPRPVLLCTPESIAAAAAADPAAWVVVFHSPFDPGTARVCAARDYR